MRDYVAGFIVGAIITGTLLVPTASAGDSFGNFNPSVRYDGSARVSIQIDSGTE